MTNIFDEIDDDIRHDRYKHLWKKYGVYVILVLVAVVVGVAGNEIWQSHTLTQAQERTGQLQNSFALPNDKMTPSLKKVIGENGNAPSDVLAQLRLATLEIKAKNFTKALADYKNITTTQAYPKLYKDLATYLSLRTQALMPKINVPELNKKVVALLKQKGPFESQLQELAGALSLREGQTEKARNFFILILKDNRAPLLMRRRAQATLNLLPAPPKLKTKVEDAQSKKPATTTQEKPSTLQSSKVAKTKNKPTSNTKTDKNKSALQNKNKSGDVKELNKKPKKKSKLKNK